MKSINNLRNRFSAAFRRYGLAFTLLTVGLLFFSSVYAYEVKTVYIYHNGSDCGGLHFWAHVFSGSATTVNQTFGYLGDNVYKLDINRTDVKGFRFYKADSQQSDPGNYNHCYTPDVRCGSGTNFWGEDKTDIRYECYHTNDGGWGLCPMWNLTMSDNGSTTYGGDGTSDNPYSVYGPVGAKVKSNALCIDNVAKQYRWKSTGDWTNWTVDKNTDSFVIPSSQYGVTIKVECETRTNNTSVNSAERALYNNQYYIANAYKRTATAYYRKYGVITAGTTGGTVELKDGEAGASASEIKKWNATTTFVATTAEEHYTFLGWFDNTTASGTPLSTELEYTVSNSAETSEDIAVYAFFDNEYETPTVSIADTAKISDGPTAILNGYMKYSGCLTDFTEYGFIGCKADTKGGDCTPDKSSPAFTWTSSSTTAIKSGATFTATATDADLLANQTYHYYAYVKSAGDGTKYYSEELGSFTTRDGCTYPEGDTVFVTIDNSLTSNNRCELKFKSFAEAIAELSTTDKHSAWLVDNFLTKHVVFQVAYGNGSYGTDNCDAFGVSIENINKWTESCSAPTHRLVIRPLDSNSLPAINGLSIKLSRWITLDGLYIKRNSNCDGMNGSALLVGPGVADNGKAAGSMTDCGIVIKNSKIEFTGFCGIHVDQCDGMVFENNEFYAYVETLGSNPMYWGAQLKFMNVKNVSILRNSFKGQHATNIFLQGSQKVLIMDNVFWNDNKFSDNVAFIRLVAMAAASSHPIQNIGIYYNTFYLNSDIDGSTAHKVDFFRYGSRSAQSSNQDAYIYSKIEFMYNNCYSYSLLTNGRNQYESSSANNTFLDVEEDNMCKYIKYNNFWSKYDASLSPTPTKSAFAFGCDDTYKNVSELVCTTTAHDPDNLVIKGTGINLGTAVTSDISGQGATSVMVDRRGNARPTATDVSSSQSGVSSSPTVSATATGISLVVSDVLASASSSVSFAAFKLTASSTVTLSLTGTNSSYFALDKSSFTVDASGNGSDDVTVTFNRPTAQGTYSANLQAVSGSVTLSIPLTGTYSNDTPLANGWTYGAYQTSESQVVSKIIWSGSANTDWDNRNNWITEDGHSVSCVDILPPDLVIVIPAPNSTAYPVPAGGIKQYPKIPAWDSKEREQYGEETVSVAETESALPTKFANTIELEYGSALMGVENLKEQDDEVNTYRYDGVNSYLTVGRKEWVLVGTVVRPFDADTATRLIMSGDFYIENHMPHVYMQQFSADDEGNIKYGTPFTSMEESVPSTSTFAIFVADQYGPSKLPASVYYKREEPNPSKLNDGTVPHSYSFNGRFENEHSLPSYTLQNGYNFLNNTYPVALSAEALETLIGTDNYAIKVFNYTDEAWVDWKSAPANDQFIKPQSGFIIKNTGSEATITLTQAQYDVTKDTKYKSAAAESGVVLRAYNTANSKGSTVGIWYDYTNVEKAFNASSTENAELYIIGSDDVKYSTITRDDMSTIVPLGVRNKSTSSMSIKFEITNSIGVESVVLEDRGASPVAYYDLLEGDNAYFTGIKPGDLEGRFFLNIDYAEDRPTEVEEEQVSDDSELGEIYITANDDVVSVSSPDGENIQQILVTDMAGRTSQLRPNGFNYSRHRLPVATGVYLITVTTTKRTVQEKVIIKD